MTALENFKGATLDTTGLPCPLPLLKTKQAMHAMSFGQCIQVTATDPGSDRDITAWCTLAGHTLIEKKRDGNTFYFLIQKN